MLDVAETTVDVEVLISSLENTKADYLSITSTKDKHEEVVAALEEGWASLAKLLKTKT